MAESPTVVRVPVTRERIVSAAVAIVDAEGAAALSMRGLAGELGVTPMALYKHVASRDDLMVAVLDATSERIVHPALPADPVERVMVVLVSLRGFLVEHPWVLRLIVGGRWSSWRGLWFQEAILAAGLDAGLSDSDAVATWTTLWQLVVGEVEFETARRAGPAGPGWSAAIANAPQPELPTLRRIAERWPDLTADFETRAHRVTEALLRTLRD